VEKTEKQHGIKGGKGLKESQTSEAAQKAVIYDSISIENVNSYCVCVLENVTHFLRYIEIQIQR
jgi:hypothetical protein